MSLLQNVYATSHITKGGGGTIDTVVVDPLGGRYVTLAKVFGAAINIVLGIGIAITVIFLILGGIQYMTARGDQKAAQAARDSLTNAVIGFVVVLGALAIKVIIGNLAGQTVTDPGTGSIVPTGIDF
jgi:hypothetical protein